MTRKPHLMLKLSLSLFMILTTFNYVHADQSSYSVAKTIEPYILSTNSMSLIKSSSCGYRIQKYNFNVDETKNNILKKLEPNDRQNAIRFLNGKKFKDLIKQTEGDVKAMLASTDKNGVNKKMHCGLVVGFNHSLYFRAKDDWDKAISNYKK